MAETAPRPNRSLLIKLGLAALVLLVGAGLVARGYDLKGLLNQGLGLIRDAGPVVFFVSMAVLPAFGAPILAFALSAGPVFSEKLGLWPVIGLALLALTVNMALSYFMASRALRPLLVMLCARLGYKLPQAESGDAADLIIVIRLTPGLPFPVQNYLLGLARVPFWKYLGLSCAITWSMVGSLIFFGDSLLNGRSGIALLAFSLFLALTAATHLVRKHYGKPKAP